MEFLSLWYGFLPLIITIENRDSPLIIILWPLNRGHTSVLLRRWICLDDGEIIANEEEYRFHTELFPGHKIVVDDSPIDQQFHAGYRLTTDIEWP
jgi:hypothetical protein